jgi:GGDEF domain-containing protein
VVDEDQIILNDLVNQADEALYTVKENGRNQV